MTQREHPRTIGWLGTTALAMGGSNQSLFLLSALIVTQGTAAVPLLVAGLLLSWFALPGWIELVLLFPKRVGGIAAACSEAFRPYSPVLANLTGMCYWWGWVPTCGLTALLSASALHEWYLPGIPVTPLAIAIVLAFTAVNLIGVRAAARVAVPLAFGSALLALLSAIVPVISGDVDWHRAASFHLTTPFHGAFGAITSAMAGLYLIGFAAPAFEAAACHVGETIDPGRNVPRAMFAAAGMASLYFVILPVVWLGVIGPGHLQGQLMVELGPTFAPLLGGLAKAAAIWFMVLNMFHGTLQPLAGASRTLSQIAEDGLIPEAFARRSRRDVPWVATCLTAGMSIVFLLSGDPTWVIAAANFTYLIGIGLPSVAVWLLRRNAPELERLYHAPRGTLSLGLGAAGVWLMTTFLGFQQFGLPTVLAGLALAYSGAGLYAWRVAADRRLSGEPKMPSSLHTKLTGAMIAVMLFDGTGYLLAVSAFHGSDGLKVALEDIFVVVAVLTISVGLILPGMIAHGVGEVSRAATRLTSGTVADLTRAMQALARGDLDAAHASKDVTPVFVHSRDEIGALADSFNLVQEEVAMAALALDGAREGLRAAEAKLEANVAEQAALARSESAARQETEKANLAKSEFLSRMSHELRTPLNAILGFGQLLELDELEALQRESVDQILSGGRHLLELIDEVLDISRIEAGSLAIAISPIDPAGAIGEVLALFRTMADARGITLRSEIETPDCVAADPHRLTQILINLVSNAVKYNREGGDVLVRCATLEDGRMRLSVHDTGPGLTPEQLEQLFHPFERLDAAERGVEGTGIGLALCRRLAEAMDGVADALSDPPHGSTFFVDLPATAQRAPEALAPGTGLDDGPPLPTATVLYVEDNPANLRLVERLFAARPELTLLTATTGAEAIELAQSALPDVVLLDLHLPDISGAMVLECLRAEPTTRRIPAIVLSADATGESRAALAAAGAAAYLTKPIELAELGEALRGALVPTDLRDAA